MNISLYSRNSNKVSKWWYSLDHTSLFAIFVILLCGLIMSYSVSPIIAQKIGSHHAHFYQRHICFAVLAIIIMLIFSFLPIQFINKISVFTIMVILGLIIIILFSDMEFKGAKRWINIFNISIQPSEFLKPFFIVTNAWFLSRASNYRHNVGYLCSTILCLLILALLILQPDFGMVLNFVAIWLVQLYLAMISYLAIGVIFIIGVIGVVLVYYNLDHVQKRVDSFLFSDTGPSYQVKKSLQAIDNGDLFGTGVFEGEIKNSLPDAHTDFIFAAMIEELGIVIAIIILLLYLLVIIRSFIAIKKNNNLFIKLILAGISFHLAFQVFVNIGVNLYLLPTKGTTLPFISYGGSSMLATSILFGILLSINRNFFGKFTKIKS
jgi:cell division protein FtsW